MERADEAKRFKPGQSGNPRGRPKGSRHRLTERFLAELADDFEKHGAATIEAFPRHFRPSSHPNKRLAAFIDLHMLDTDKLRAAVSQTP